MDRVPSINSDTSDFEFRCESIRLPSEFVCRDPYDPGKWTQIGEYSKNIADDVGLTDQLDALNDPLRRALKADVIFDRIRHTQNSELLMRLAFEWSLISPDEYLKYRNGNTQELNELQSNSDFIDKLSKDISSALEIVSTPAIGVILASIHSDQLPDDRLDTCAEVINYSLGAGVRFDSDNRDGYNDNQHNHASIVADSDNYVIAFDQYGMYRPEDYLHEAAALIQISKTWQDQETIRTSSKQDLKPEKLGWLKRLIRRNRNDSQESSLSDLKRKADLDPVKIVDMIARERELFDLLFSNLDLSKLPNWSRDIA